MNFTTLKLSGAIAATAIVGSVLTSAPAQAIGVTAGDTLVFNGNVNLSNVAVGSTATLDFSTLLPPTSNSARIQLGTTTSTFGSLLTTFTASSLLLTRTATNTWTLASPAPTPWLSNLSGNSFLLNSFTLTQDTPATGLFNPGSFSANFTGVFSPGTTPGTGGLAGIGSLGITINPDGTYLASVKAVPTPALVPAALGFAATLLRKRKGEVKAEQETAGVKA
jgi:hypothetical protein